MEDYYQTKILQDVRSAAEKAGKKEAAAPVEQRIREAVILLKEKKGEDIRVLNLSQVNNYLEYFVIVTANSENHLRGLARDVMRLMKKLHDKRIGDLEPGSKGWILLDYVDVIFQIFTLESRNYYNLEKLWGDSNDLTGKYT